jgi:hypothetical protein
MKEHRVSTPEELESALSAQFFARLEDDCCASRNTAR